MGPASSWTGRLRTGALALSLCLVAMIGQSLPAGAVTTCTHTAPANLVTVTLGAGDGTLIERSGNQIFVDGVQCDGAATVTNTDTIHVNQPVSGTSFVTISLAGGRFAPGVTTVGEGSSPEIEFEIALGDQNDGVTITGGASRDRIRLGSGGINLNAGESNTVDADITVFMGIEGLSVLGGGGDDVLGLQGGAGTGSGFNLTVAPPFLIGEGGDDRLTGGSTSGEIMEGRGGDDVLKAGPAGSALRPGGGRDNVTGGPATNDSVEYIDAPSGVTVDLARTDRQNTGGAGRDRIRKVEYLLGSDFKDDLAGNEVTNQITGFQGKDRIRGRGATDDLFGNEGDDSLLGGTGDDTLNGGPDTDTCDGGPGTNTLIDCEL